MKYKLSNICEYVKGKVAVSTLNTSNYISTENMLPSKGGIVDATTLPPAETTQSYSKDDVLVSNIRPYFEKIWKANSEGGCSNDVLVFRAKPQVNPTYLYYVLSDKQFFDYATATSKGTKMPRGDRSAIMEYEIEERSRKEQDNIAAILYSLDKKIELNNKINNNLYEQVKALYSQMFVNICNDNRQKCRMEEFFDISIGKTPPRKESQWFSNSSNNRVWVSISDMGNAELYISNSSEYLTHEAVDKFNVKIIPDNTVILSFKLTVGRVAITDGEITTNEAIAHFKTNKAEINEYLYCYLKDFNYQTMGSTSSIATAVNSKIIKAMPFVIPTEDELNRFHDFAAPIFGMIKNNQRENVRMAIIRDTLLPKLMSGEVDISNIDI